MSDDAPGNTTAKTDSTGTTNYSWDFSNKLSSVLLPAEESTSKAISIPADSDPVVGAQWRFDRGGAQVLH